MDEMVDRLGGGDISGFLRHFLLRTHERVNKVDVFPLFKRDVKTLGPDRALADLGEMGAIYAELIRPAHDGSKVSTGLHDLNGTSVDSHRIASMQARSALSETDFVSLARLAELPSFRGDHPRKCAEP